MDKQEKLKQVKDFIRYGGKCFFDDPSDYDVFKEEVEKSFVHKHDHSWSIERPTIYPCVICPYSWYDERYAKTIANATYVYLADFGIETLENT